MPKNKYISKIEELSKRLESYIHEDIFQFSRTTFNEIGKDFYLLLTYELYDHYEEDGKIDSFLQVFNDFELFYSGAYAKGTKIRDSYDDMVFMINEINLLHYQNRKEDMIEDVEEIKTRLRTYREKI